MKSLNEYYDHHPNDSRVTGPHTIANSVCARYGTGGGNTPLVLHSESKERGETVGGESDVSDNGSESGYEESDLCGCKETNAVQLRSEPTERSKTVGGESRSGDGEPGDEATDLRGRAERYYMTDKAGHMCRWKLLKHAMTLQSSDYKDPPAIMVVKK